MGIPVILVTAVPDVARMVGVNRILRGNMVTCPLGNPDLSTQEEADLRKKYVVRALDILQMEVEEPKIFTLDSAL